MGEMINVFPCPLCDEWLPVKTSKKNKPYILCPECGVQMFVRYKIGERRMSKKCKKKNIDDLKYR